MNKEFAKQGAVVFGVSADDEKLQGKFIAEHTLNFPLLSDTDKKMLEKYGVWVEKINYGKTYMGIERTTVVIDKAGTVRTLFRKVRVDGHAAEVLDAVKGLG